MLMTKKDLIRILMEDDHDENTPWFAAELSDEYIASAIEDATGRKPLDWQVDAVREHCHGEMEYTSELNKEDVDYWLGCYNGENKIYKVRVFDITWDIADEMEECGESYDEVIKQHSLPTDTEVEFIFSSNSTATDMIDAISEVLCNDYHFCVKDFAWEMIEESNVM